SEFLSHYYEGRMKPLHAYAFGMIDKWSQIGSAMPAFSNFLLNNSLTKSLIGIHHKRTLPKYAKESFKEWWKRRSSLRVPPFRRGEAIPNSDRETLEIASSSSRT